METAADKIDILPSCLSIWQKPSHSLSRQDSLSITEVDGKLYGYIPSFKDHQRITGKEATSPEKYPAPPGKQPGSDWETPVKQPGSQEGKGKGMEKQERGCRGKPNTAPSPEPPVRKQPGDETPNPKTPQSETPGTKPPEPPSSGNTHGERWTKQQGMELERLTQDIRDRYGERYHGRVQNFVRANYNRCNPEAMLKCLLRLIMERKKGESIPLPERWLESVLNGNGKHPGKTDGSRRPNRAGGAERKTTTPRIET
jgi:hypothetical protein